MQWWSLDGQGSRVYNPKSVLTTINWGRESNLRSTSMLSKDRRLMTTTEWTRLEDLFEKACATRTWEVEDRDRDHQIKGRPKRVATRLWNKQAGTYALEQRWGRKRPRMESNESGEDKIDGYLSRKDFQFAPIRVMQDDSTDRASAVLSNRDFSVGDRITPMGGKLFLIKSEYLSGHPRENYRVVKRVGQENLVLALYKQGKENTGMGHLCRIAQGDEEANAEEQAHARGVRIIASRPIQKGEEIIVDQDSAYGRNEVATKNRPTYYCYKTGGHLVLHGSKSGGPEQDPGPHRKDEQATTH